MGENKPPCHAPAGWPAWELIHGERWRSVHPDGRGLLEIRPIGGWHEAVAYSRTMEGHSIQAGHLIEVAPALRRCMVAVGLEVSDG